MLFKEIVSLTKKEMLLEWKQKFALGGIMLYVVSTVFVSYLAFRGVIADSAWIALFWIILLFASVNAAAKSFMSESGNRMLYYYSLASAESIILSKIFYNVLLLMLISILHLTFFSLLVGNPMINFPLFLITVFLGSCGLASTLTLVSAIASKAGTNSTLMAILGFPILLPLLLTCIRLTRSASLGVDFSIAWKFIIVLIALNMVVSVLSYILFPYLWRE